MSDQINNFIQKISGQVDWAKISKAMQMLKKDTHMLFVERTKTGIMGVVKSQSEPDREYSSVIGSDGTYSCGTHRFFRCGGLRGGICKHCLLVIFAGIKSNQISIVEAIDWVKSTISRTPIYDKAGAHAIFTKYEDAKTGKIEWRPVEILPEDLLAL